MFDDVEALRIPIDAFSMQLRPSELVAVAAGLGGTFAPTVLADALRALPASERAPLWELATRHYARRKPVNKAAGEIGMDTIRARALLDALARALLSS